MFRSVSFCFAMVAATALSAQEVTSDVTASLQEIVLGADGVDLAEFKWQKRPLIVFAESPADPRFVQQMEFITAELEELSDRDVVVLTDTDPSLKTALRRKLHPRGFMLALVGKDGTIKLRKPVPWDVRELSRVIDKMPMRQQEVRDRRGDS
ncbi:MAG: DUF4174 domain-containing protein [Pseudomonadota bacterium]